MSSEPIPGWHAKIETRLVVDSQLLDFRRYIEARGWILINEYVDVISGAKDRVLASMTWFTMPDVEVRCRGGVEVGSPRALAATSRIADGGVAAARSGARESD